MFYPDLLSHRACQALLWLRGNALSFGLICKKKRRSQNKKIHYQKQEVWLSCPSTRVPFYFPFFFAFSLQANGGGSRN